MALKYRRTWPLAMEAAQQPGQAPCLRKWHASERRQCRERHTPTPQKWSLGPQPITGNGIAAESGCGTTAGVGSGTAVGIENVTSGIGRVPGVGSGTAVGAGSDMALGVGSGTAVGAGSGMAVGADGRWQWKWHRAVGAGIVALDVARPPAQEAARPLALKVAPPSAQEAARPLALEVARLPAPEAARL